MTIKEDLKSIDLLPGELVRRFKTPLKSVTFWMHLVVAVIGLGGAGFWYSMIECRLLGEWNLTSIAAALCTYFPAIAGAAYVDSSSEGQPYFRSFGILASAVFVILFFLSVLTIREVSVFLSGIGSVLSILFWWVVNADKSCFRDVDGDGSTPNPNRKLKGNRNGWQS